MAKKKKKTADLIVRSDGSVVANKDRKIAPVKTTPAKKTEKSSDLIPLLNKSTKNLALSNLALRQGDVQGINKLKSNLEENKKIIRMNMVDFLENKEPYFYCRTEEKEEKCIESVKEVFGEAEELELKEILREILA